MALIGIYLFIIKQLVFVWFRGCFFFFNETKWFVVPLLCSILSSFFFVWKHMLCGLPIIICFSVLFSSILKALLVDLVQKSVAGRHPKLMLRRSESVVEKLLTNWLSLCLYKHLKVSWSVEWWCKWLNMGMKYWVMVQMREYVSWSIELWYKWWNISAEVLSYGTNDGIFQLKYWFVVLLREYVSWSIELWYKWRNISAEALSFGTDDGMFQLKYWVMVQMREYVSWSIDLWC